MHPHVEQATLATLPAARQRPGRSWRRRSGACRLWRRRHVDFGPVRLHVERGKNLDGSNVKADLAAIEAVVAVDDLTANFEMNAHFSPLLRVLGDRAGMITAPSSHERINETNSREVPVGTDAFAYVDEDLDGPYTQE